MMSAKFAFRLLETVWPLLMGQFGQQTPVESTAQQV